MDIKLFLFTKILLLLNTFRNQSEYIDKKKQNKQKNSTSEVYRQDFCLKYVVFILFEETSGK